MRRVLLWVLAVTCVAVLCAGAVAGGAAGKRPVKVKCRHGAVPVKILKKTTCRALPKPSKGDARLAFFQKALAFNPAVLDDRHGHPLQPISKVVGARTYGRIVHDLPGALARLDKLVAQHTKPSLAHAARGGCSSAQYGAFSTTGSLSDGSSLSLDGSANGSATATVSTNAGNGMRITVSFNVDDCDHFDGPQCPTPEGVLKATDANPLDVRTTITQGGKLLRSEVITTIESQKLQGQLADDAKFDTLDIDDTSKFHYAVAGSQVAHAVTITGQVDRSTRVNMRTGNYVPSSGGVTVSASVDGAATDEADLANLAAQSEADADKAFGKIVTKEINRFHARETGSIDKANNCAQLAFDPDSNTRTVNKGDTGSFTARVSAKEGGEAAKGKWQTTSQQNGTFPGSASGGATALNYTVATHVHGTTLSAGLKATSTAGVATGTWTQKIHVDTINTITGSFAGHDEDQGAIYDWQGTATFKRVDDGTEISGAFQLVSGQATVTASGTGPDGCARSGTQVLQLSPDGVIAIEGDVKPYSYQMTAPFDGHTMSITETCPPPTGTIPTQTQPGSAEGILSGDFLNGGIAAYTQTSPDGFSYNGSSTTHDGDPGETETYSWQLTGTP